MKKIVYLTLSMLFVIILGACAKATSQPTDEMINPGDKIGDFLITTGEEENVTYGFDLSCVKQGEGENYSCKAPVGTEINIATGIYDDTVSSVPTTATPKLNEKWSSWNYLLFIEDRPVNLQAFGYIETLNPMVGVIRYWNVVIIASKPGEITIRDSGVIDSKPFESTTTYTFIAPQ